MKTASQITLQQIEKLLGESIARGDRDIACDCEDALGRPHGPCYRRPTEAESAFARGRLVYVWNSRHGADQ